MKFETIKKFFVLGDLYSRQDSSLIDTAVTDKPDFSTLEGQRRLMEMNGDKT